MSNSLSPLWTIGLGTISISAAGGILTGSYAIFKNKPDAGFLTGAATLNSGVTAFVFLTCREYAVTPLLANYAFGEQYARRRQELGINPLPMDADFSQAVTWPTLRWNKLLDSGLTGAITGGTLRGIRSGPRSILPGALTVGIACTVLQYCFNELSVLRLRYVSSLQQEVHPGRQAGQSTQRALNAVSESPFQSLMKLFGVIPISDEEYLMKLKQSREIYLKRITELEKRVEEDKMLIELSDTKNP